MTQKNDFGTLLAFSKNGILLKKIDNVEFVKYSPAMLLDGKKFTCTASNMISKIHSDRVLNDDQKKSVTAYLFGHLLVENVVGFYYDGGGHSRPAVVYIDPEDSSKVITLTTIGKAYENFTVFEV